MADMGGRRDLQLVEHTRDTIYSLCKYARGSEILKLKQLLRSPIMANFNFILNEAVTGTSFYTSAITWRNLDALWVLASDTRIPIHKNDLRLAKEISPKYLTPLVTSPLYLEFDNLTSRIISDLRYAAQTRNADCISALLAKLMIVPSHVACDHIIMGLMGFSGYRSLIPPPDNIIGFDDGVYPVWMMESLRDFYQTRVHSPLPCDTFLLCPHHVLRQIYNNQFGYSETDDAAKTRVKLGHYYYLIALLFGPAFAARTGFSIDLVNRISGYVFYVDILEDAEMIWKHLDQFRQSRMLLDNT